MSGKSSGPAPHHRPVRVERLAYPRLEIRPGLGNDDAGERVLDEGVEQVLLAREMVVDAHRLAAVAGTEPPRRQAAERCLVVQALMQLFVTVIVLGLDPLAAALVGYVAATVGMIQQWNVHGKCARPSGSAI